VLVGLLVVGLLVGTATHVENIARAGLVPRPDLPLVCNVFWSGLVLVDPLVALALLVRPRIGILLLLGLMAVDLTVNLVFLGVNGAVVTQMAYAILSLAALPVLRRRHRDDVQDPHVG
jgi:uncharacterized membrane protein YuzA (DUF378 family)